MNDRDDREARVDQCVARQDTDSACKLLYDLIVEYAKEKKFVKAEALYEKLYETDPMALTEIVRAGEIIEEEKSNSVDRAHLEIWRELYQNLSTAESNALYYSMKPETFQPGKAVMEQGSLNSRLYFIDKGDIEALYHQGEMENLICSLKAADIFGQESFFTATVCTVSIITLSTVKVNYLEFDVLKTWKKEVPALEGKLQNYCMKRDVVKQAMENKGLERRCHKRFKLSGALTFQILEKSGAPIGRAYKGDFEDISAGGLSFFIKSAKKENIRLILGRRVRVGFQLPVREGDYVVVEAPMTVIAAQAQMFDDYSIHVKFDKPWNAKTMSQIDVDRPVLQLSATTALETD